MSTCSYSIYKKQLEESLDLNCLFDEANSLLRSITSDSEDHDSFDDEKDVFQMTNDYEPWMKEVLLCSSSEDESNVNLKADLMFHRYNMSNRDFVSKFLKENNSYLSYMNNKTLNQNVKRGFLNKGAMLKDSKLRNLALKRKTKELDMIRKRIWKQICKKEIPKSYKSRTQFISSKLNILRKASQQATKKVRSKALESKQHAKREVVIGRAKRMSREAQFFWKKYVKVEKTQKKKAEKQALVKKKLDFELQQASEQKQKLNFLITQVELYAHMTAFNLKKNSTEYKTKQEKILSQLNHVDKEKDLFEKLSFTAENVMHKVSLIAGQRPSFEKDVLSYPQPTMFNGKLSEYQIKGMNWLSTLYSNHLNGILADDMGLGKTVQAIAFLSHLAEVHEVWGPFLVVAPSSTLNNWHQEFTKFLPAFKILPYWGNINQRRDLRLYWTQSNISSSDSAPFHVLVTSYQLILSDVTYFEKINWQYIILDEAQALKSSNSLRWKTLLNFRCRNRLLLTGTPVQNTMAELWSLLHFIMPALFDSQAEFHEWFSRDIENHIENKAKVDQIHLQRLHLVLKPFILRRLKSEVEHELTAKVEVKIVCELSPRQKNLYEKLQKNLNVASFLSENTTSRSLALYNLVMQFRKVCNHPDLFQERKPKTSFYYEIPKFYLPRLIFNEMITIKKANCFCTDLNIHNPAHINLSMNQSNNTFSFLAFLGLSVGEYNNFFNDYGIVQILKLCSNQCNKNILKYLRENFFRLIDSKYSFTIIPTSNKMTAIENTCCYKLFNITSNQFNTLQSNTVKYYVKINSERVLKNAYRNEKTPFSSSLNHIYLPSIINPPQSLYCSHFSFFYKQIIDPPPALLSDSNVFINFSSRDQFITDSAKMTALDKLLSKLKVEGHRVLIYSQMTKMIDILEDYMVMRKLKYLRVDGSSGISSRRDKVADFQTSSDIFAFLLSTRAGGVGINLTAADTVIFYDSDWNPSMDQQAMDRAHRLGQKKQVTVYRLVCKDTVDERILERAEEKNIIQKMVISGETSSMVKPSEVASLLVDDKRILDEVLKEDQKQKCRFKKQANRNNDFDNRVDFDFMQNIDSNLLVEEPNSSCAGSSKQSIISKAGTSKRGRPKVENTSGITSYRLKRNLSLPKTVNKKIAKFN